MATQHKQIVALDGQQSCQTKKKRILALYRDGLSDIHELAQTVGASISYAAAVLKDAGLLNAYYDLFTSSSHRMNEYGVLFQGALSFKNVAAAQASVNRIDQIYRYFAFLGDRAGQHHAMLVSLTGRNRALASNKIKESEVFSEWLIAHLESPADALAASINGSSSVGIDTPA
jgi:hypothetical protein